MWPPDLTGRGGQILVGVLMTLFGISSWIEVNGLWVELPLLVAKLPEQGLLASYISVLAQAANLGPLLYSFARYRWKEKLPNKLLIHVTMLVGTVSTLLLIWFWCRTSVIGGNLHSTGFLALAFSLAFVDCTSSVLYLPFVGSFPRNFLMFFLVGEGLSGLLPALVALAQGVGGNPRCQYVNITANETVLSPIYSDPLFSLEAFFGFLTVMLCISWTAFFILTFLPDSVTRKEATPGENSTILSKPSFEAKRELSNSTTLLQPPPLGSSVLQYTWLLLGLQACICFLTNGFMTSIQPFSCLAYGNVAYHLSVTLSCLANPVACLIALRWHSARIRVLVATTSIGILSSAYILATAIMSPQPPMVGTPSGEVVLVLSWVLFTGTLSYSKAFIASFLQGQGGPKALFRYGSVTQVGSCIGAILSFCLANFTNVFVFYVPCTG